MKSLSIFILALMLACGLDAQSAHHQALRAKKASGGGGGCTPSYADALGTGNRTNAITVTVASGLLDTSGNFPWALVNGVTNSENLAYFTGGIDLSTGGPWFITYDFHTPVIIVESRFWQQTGADQGVWRWQGGADNSNWTDIGGTFSLVDGLSIPTVCTTLSGNTTAYRYYRRLGVSGTTSSGPYIYEEEFKICAP